MRMEGIIMKGLEGYVKAIKDLLEIGISREVIIRAIDSLYDKEELNGKEVVKLMRLVYKV